MTAPRLSIPEVAAFAAATLALREAARHVHTTLTNPALPLSGTVRDHCATTLATALATFGTEPHVPTTTEEA